MMADDSDVKTNCITACLDANGNILALVVKTDGESFYSFIFRILDIKTGARETVYEAPVWLTSMTISASGTIFAVDADGVVHSDETGSFTKYDTKSPPGFTRIWCLDDQHVFACGRGGVMVRKSGAQWIQFNSGLDGDLYGVHGTSSRQIYTVGEEGRIFHYNGREWTRVDPPTNYILNAVLCVTSKRVFICGEGGAIFEGAQSQWQPLEAPAITYYSLAEFRGQIYVAAGGDGVFVIDGNGLKLIKKLTIYNLVTCGNLLLAIGDDLVGRFDGNAWKGNRFN
jgi:photosystem II stability/assembly factor-like uncharacterized protein